MDTKFDFNGWNKRLEGTDTLEPFRALLEGWFLLEDLAHREERRAAGYEEGYRRRPAIGLYLPGNGFTLAVRPIYHKAKKTIEPASMTVEIVGPPNIGSIHLAPGHARWRSIRVSSVEEVFEAVVDTARRMVADPWRVFMGSAGKCCRCRRRLSDIISRTRGIGPECIQRFVYFGATLRHQGADVQTAIAPAFFSRSTSSTSGCGASLT
jgi:hypothetical protein